MGMSVCACIPRSVLMMVVLIIKMEVTGDSGGGLCLSDLNPHPPVWHTV